MVKDDLLKCDQCGYKCKKSLSLRKHINTKHEAHKCEDFPVCFYKAMDLQQHNVEDRTISVGVYNKEKESKEDKKDKQYFCKRIKGDEQRCLQC